MQLVRSFIRTGESCLRCFGIHPAGRHGAFRCLLLSLAAVLATTPTVAPAEDGSTDPLRLFGDFRLRLEQDWDSLQGDGTKRDDRLRLRIRLRGGLEYHFDPNWSVKVQARSGPDLSQQSPHITIHDFDGGGTGPYEFNLDHWFVRYQNGGFEAWGGRNLPSFLHQDDLFIFDNVTYAGVGGSYTWDFDANSIYLSFNYVALPVGMRDFVGEAVISQLAWQQRFEKSVFSVGLGYRFSNGDPDDPAGATLLTGNSGRDYREWSLQLQYRTELFGQPLLLGADVMHNAADYDNAPVGSFTNFHRNDVNGYVAEVLLGGKEPGNWQFGYFYSRVEALASNSSYVQDDWVRWGNANQVRATNLRGSELRVLYTLRENLNVFARLFFVDAVDLLEPGDNTKETGNRFRIEFNWSF